MKGRPSCCTLWQWIFIIGAGTLFTASLLTFIMGYAVPKARFDGYSLSLCLCLSTTISSGPPYTGSANLQFDRLIKDVAVVTSKSLGAVRNFMAANYRTDSQVPCYQNGEDIQVSLFTNVIAIIFGVVTMILAICFFIGYVVSMVRHRRRRNYVDLDEVAPEDPKSKVADDL